MSAIKTWDTNSLPPADRLPYWREVLCEAFTALTTEPQDAPERRSIVTLKEFGEVNGVALTSFSQVINHGPAEVRRSQDAFFFVNYQLQGDCHAEQDGRATCVGPGQFYVVDTRRPYRLDFTEGFHTLSFRFPMRQLAPLLGDPRRITACSIDQRTPLGGLAASHMRDVLRCARDLPPEASRSLAETLGRLIGLAIGQMPQDDPVSQARTRAVLHDSIVQYMRDHSTEPDLSLASVAARFRMSPRTLQAALAARGSSFTEVVLDARLDMASRALTRAGARVTQVAYDCGFGDLSYFGRAFRRRYGCAPRDWQRGRTSPAPRPAAPDLR